MIRSLTPLYGLSILVSILILSILASVVFAENLSRKAGKKALAEKSSSEYTSVPDDGAFDVYTEDLDERREIVTVNDPFEPLNRVSFWFNDRFYFLLFKPVARAYRVVPEPARISVSNFFSNLKAPARFISSLLQLKIKDAGNELARFIINSTVGIGGLFDPARKWARVKIKEEDFGQVLGRYGIGPGNYVVLPLLGPSNTRDGFGDLIDILLDPITYNVENFGQYFAVKTFDGLTAASIDKDTYERLKKQALDPYIFMRNVYMQRRKGMVEK